MGREVRQAVWLAALAAAFFGCGATGPDVGGESHFVCGEDADCPISAPLCVRHVCQARTPLERDSGAGGADSDAGTGAGVNRYEGSVSAGGGPGAATGGAPTSGTGGSSGDTGTPGDGGDVHDASDAACVDHSLDAPHYDAGDCRELDSLVLQNPVVMDDSGDGVLSPGEHGTISVTWRETEGFGVSWYPGVKFSTPVPGVGVGVDWRYAALPCRTDTLQTDVTLPADIPLHTEVVVTAKIAMIGSDCPLADSLDISISVGDPLR